MEHVDLKLIVKCIGVLFFAVLFIQSGLDKVFDWSGNLDWLKGYFAKSPFKNQVPFLLGVLTLLEVASGLICLWGAAQIVLKDSVECAQLGLAVSAFTFLALFMGQRIAKDYVGAASIAPYFLLNLYLFHHI